LLKGMWELPMVEGDLAALQKTFSIEPYKPLKEVRHSVLNKRLKIFPFLCRPKKNFRGAQDDRAWLSAEELNRYAMSSMNHKIIKQLTAAGPELPSSDTDRCLKLS
jgi:adenine-specific DNA glycosylase